jgi:hypothetical protein
MAQPIPTAKKADSTYWTRLALLGLSGAAYMLIALWVNQAIGEFFLESRLLDGGGGWATTVALFIMFFSVLPLAFLLARACAKASSYRYWDTWDLAWRWAVGVFAIWLVSLFVGDVGLIGFLLFWPAYAFLLTPRVRQERPKTKPRPRVYPLPDDPKPQPARRGRRRGGVAGNFGRIPKETEALLRELVRQVTGPIAAALPTGAPAALRRATVRIVLEAVLQTWWSDERAEPLDSIDIQRLHEAICLATELAGGLDVESQGVYRGVLRGLVGGWLQRRF